MTIDDILMGKDYRRDRGSGRCSLYLHMGSSHKTINVRLPAALADKFAKLAAEIPGLPQSVILRLIISNFLDGDLDEQIQQVTRFLLKPDSGKSVRRIATRLPLPNSNKTH